MNKERAYYIKPFTKAWFINIWFHYKIHILIGAFVLALLGLYTYELITKPKYDFSMIYIGNNISSLETEIKTLSDDLSKVAIDVNNDGKVKVSCESIFVSKDIAKKDSSAKAQLEKSEMEVRNGEVNVYLFGGGYEQDYVGDGVEDRLYDLTALAEKYGYGEDMVKRYPDGSVYAISMENNPCLKFDTKDVYIVVRPFLGDENKKKEAFQYEIDLKMAEYIISRGEYDVKR